VELLGRPTGLILFTGHRLWPQIDALAQWGPGLEAVQILVAHGDEQPGGPADRLASFVEDFLPGVIVGFQGPVNDDEPGEVLGLVAEAASSDRQWLLDASGGTRLMFAGALLAAERLKHLKVIHRDAVGPWYHLAAGGGTRQLVGVDPKAVDRFTVESLLAVTWADEEREARVLQEEVEPEIQVAADEVFGGAEWRRAFAIAAASVRTRLGGSCPGEGSLFERFILRLIRRMGVEADDVALSVVLYDGRRQLQEVDIVVNSGGRLHVIDCKLAEEVKSIPIGTQIREAYATKRLLGDGADQFILLRPTIEIAPEFKKLCQEYDIRVIDRLLLEGASLSAVIERYIHPPVAGRMDAIGSGRSVRLSVSDGVVDLASDFIQARERARLYDHGTVLVLKVAGGPAYDPGVLREALEKNLDGIGEVLDVTRNPTRTNVSFTVRAYKRHLDRVRLIVAAIASGTADT